MRAARAQHMISIELRRGRRARMAVPAVAVSESIPVRNQIARGTSTEARGAIQAELDPIPAAPAKTLRNVGEIQ